MLRRFRIFLDGVELAYLGGQSREQAEEVFRAMQALADKLGYPQMQEVTTK